MGIQLQDFPYYDNSGGLDLKSSATKVAEDDSTQSENMDYFVDGAALSRNGSSIFNKENQMDQLETRAFYDYRRSDANNFQIIAAGSKIKQDLVAPTDMVIGLDPDAIAHFEEFVTNDNEYLIYGNGIDNNLKFDGNSWTDLSINVRPPDPTFNSFAAGNLPPGNYFYYVEFGRTVAGILVQESDLNPTPLMVTVPAGPDQSVTINIPISADPQVNARIIFRSSPTSAGVFYRQGIVPNNVTATFIDNVALDGSIPAFFGNQPAPKTNIFCEFMGYMLYANDATTLPSVRYKPWNAPQAGPILFDGPINCLRNIYGVCLVSTSNGSLWVLDGDPTTTAPRRISSSIGILNNRCADGPGPIYILATNHKFYALTPTDFAQSEIRINQPISIRVEPYIENISFSNPDAIVLKYYTSSNQSKVAISVPFGGNTNTNVLIYNETQSFMKQKPVWHPWTNLNASALDVFIIDGENVLVSGDYNGYIWKLDDQNMLGDGAEINGIATSGTNNTLTDLILSGAATSGTLSTLTDASQMMIPNSLTGDYLSIVAGTGNGQARIIISNTDTTFSVFPDFGIAPDNTSIYEIGPFEPASLQGIITRIIGGTGLNQFRTISSNTNTTLTFSANWVTNPDNTSEFTVGGFDQIHFTNWKSVNGSYDALKQLWYIITNLNNQGNYTIELIIQFDFDTTTTNQKVLLINLQSPNTIWGQFIWGQALWGANSVFQDRIRVFGRFRAIRFGFRSRQAGHPFQLNGLSASVQDKGLYFGSAP